MQSRVNVNNGHVYSRPDSKSKIKKTLFRNSKIMCMSGAMENGFLPLDGEEGGYIYANHVLQPKE